MLTTITLAGRITAQGICLQDHADGRVTISTGTERLTGWPILRRLKAATAALALAILPLVSPPRPRPKPC
ncbi:MAG: hypothetical protein HZT43_03665 [Exiguobacterium profundum]|nr:MAG: hypothetical protein HZT43_03665 [Exiguobacterium profundum]